MTAVFILEDDEATLDSLTARIEAGAGFSVVGTATTLSDARGLLQSQTPDVLLFDLQLPDGESFDLISDYTNTNPACPILVISVFGDEGRVIRAISAGAGGYLLKDDPGAQIVEAISAVLRGESPISPAIAKHLIRRLHPPPPDTSAPMLSDRELEVLKLAAKGMTYREVAGMLGVSVNTVGTYTMRVYTKLAVSSRTEALFEARKLGLMDG